jgi:hypothetical protein
MALGVKDALRISGRVLCGEGLLRIEHASDMVLELRMFLLPATELVLLVKIEGIVRIGHGKLLQSLPLP